MTLLRTLETEPTRARKPDGCYAADGRVAGALLRRGVARGPGARSGCAGGRGKR